MITVRVSNTTLIPKTIPALTKTSDIEQIQMTFSREWNNYIKTVTFFDARGTAYHVDVSLLSEVYVNVPVQALQYAGLVKFVAEGFEDNEKTTKRITSETGYITVSYTLAQNAKCCCGQKELDRIETIRSNLKEDVEYEIQRRIDAGDIKGQAGKINVGSVTTLKPKDNAYVKNSGTDENAVLNFGIPKGDKGDTGVYVLDENENVTNAPSSADVIVDPYDGYDLEIESGLTVLGVYETSAELEADVTDPSQGDCYLIGDDANYFIYIYDSELGWVNAGNITGIKGDKGDKGEDGAKVSSVVKTSSDGLVDTYTMNFDDGTSSTFNVTNGKDVTPTEINNAVVNFLEADNGKLGTVNLLKNGSFWAFDDLLLGYRRVNVSVPPFDMNYSGLQHIETTIRPDSDGADYISLDLGDLEKDKIKFIVLTTEQDDDSYRGIITSVIDLNGANNFATGIDEEGNTVPWMSNAVFNGNSVVVYDTGSQIQDKDTLDGITHNKLTPDATYTLTVYYGDKVNEPLVTYDRVTLLTTGTLNAHSVGDIFEIEYKVTTAEPYNSSTGLANFGVRCNYAKIGNTTYSGNDAQSSYYRHLEIVDIDGMVDGSRVHDSVKVKYKVVSLDNAVFKVELKYNEATSNAADLNISKVSATSVVGVNKGNETTDSYTDTAIFYVYPKDAYLGEMKATINSVSERDLYSDGLSNGWVVYSDSDKIATVAKITNVSTVKDDMNNRVVVFVGVERFKIDKQHGISVRLEAREYCNDYVGLVMKTTTISNKPSGGGSTGGGSTGEDTGGVSGGGGSTDTTTVYRTSVTGDDTSSIDTRLPSGLDIVSISISGDAPPDTTFNYFRYVYLTQSNITNKFTGTATCYRAGNLVDVPMTAVYNNSTGQFVTAVDGYYFNAGSEYSISVIYKS